MCVRRKRKLYVREIYFGWAGRGWGGKTMLDVTLCIPNWSAVAVIGVDTGTFTVLGFTFDL
jgi:hypothetical protein